MRIQAIFVGAALASTPVACADDSAVDVDEGAASATTGDANDDTNATTSGGGTTATDVADGLDDTAPDSTEADTSDDEADVPVLPYARGIRVPRVTINQAVQVTLVDDGIEVPGRDYNTRVISGRRALLRGFWSLHADFEPRELIGRLTVDYADGTQVVQDYSVMVTGDSGDGGASFQWLLEPDQMVPGMNFRVRVLEADPEYGGGEVSDPPPIAPLPGRGTLALYDVPLQIRTILVPVQHEFEGCVQTPEPTEDDVDVMRQQLEQSNPVQSAIVTVGEPMIYTDAIGTAGQGFSGILGALSLHRDAIKPADNEYLYGLLDPCDGFPPGLLGQAIGIPGAATPELAGQRISTGRWLGSGLPTSETYVHEVGHSQGRRHVFCSGGEAGTDANYPHAGGRIGVWGFGIYDFQLRTPTGARDYMTYCSNEWVSDYAWEQTLEVIEVLTSWDGQAPVSTGEVLMGAVQPDGRARWWTTHGAVDPTLLPSPHALELSIDGATVLVEATTQPLPDGVATMIVAPLPAGWQSASGLRLLGPSHATVIDPAVVGGFAAAAGG